MDMMEGNVKFQKVIRFINNLPNYTHTGYYIARYQGGQFWIMERTHDLGGTDYSYIYKLTDEEAVWLSENGPLREWMNCVTEYKEKIMSDEKKTIAYWVAKAYEALHEAEAIADATGESFSFSPSYGMGGYYTPQPIKPDVMTKEKALKILESGVEITPEIRAELVQAIANNSISTSDDDWESSGEYGWMSSSQSC